MKEYRVEVRVSNNLIREAMERAGYVGRGADARLMRDAGLDATRFYDVVGLRAAPLLKSGEFSTVAKKLMEVLGAAPSDLWTEEQLTMELQKSRAWFECDADALAAISAEGIGLRLGRDPEEATQESDVRRAVNNVLKTLTPREEKVLRLRNGIGCEEQTLHDTGLVMGVTQERVRQIEAKAMRKLRHPYRSRLLADKPMLPMTVERCEGVNTDLCHGCRRKNDIVVGRDYRYISPPLVKKDGKDVCKMLIKEIK